VPLIEIPQVREAAQTLASNANALGAGATPG
jgi:hypothetical protein